MSDNSLQIFADEAEDLLGVAEQALLNLDNLDNQSDTLDGINDLFRTFHTIKGAAGLFGLDDIVEFTHIVESVLVIIREGSLTVDEELVSLFLLSRDHLESLVNNALGGTGGVDDELKRTDNELIEKLNNCLGVTPTNEEIIATTPATNVADENIDGVVNKDWHISLRFGINAFRNGMDPASFINYLNKIGELKYPSGLNTIRRTVISVLRSY